MRWTFARVWLAAVAVTAILLAAALVSWLSISLVAMLAVYLIAAFVTVAAVVVVLALPGFSSAVVRRVSRQRPADAPARPAHGGVQPRARRFSDARRLTTVELINAWRSSYAGLQRARTVGETARIAARRQQYIDELERRDPGGFERWLVSGDSPASDASSFLADDDGGAQLPEVS
ncbi:MAG: hypothetical protein ACRDO2_12360 [Nocardioidaceae bacterium]